MPDSVHLITEYELSCMLSDCFVQLREFVGDDAAADAVDVVHEALTDETPGVRFTDESLRWSLAAHGDAIVAAVGDEHAVETVRIVRHTLTDDFYTQLET